MPIHINVCCDVCPTAQGIFLDTDAESAMDLKIALRYCGWTIDGPMGTKNQQTTCPACSRKEGRNFLSAPTPDA